MPRLDVVFKGGTPLSLLSPETLTFPSANLGAGKENMKTLKQKAYQLAMKRFIASLKRVGATDISLALLHGMDFLNFYHQALKELKKHGNNTNFKSKSKVLEV